MKKVNQKLLKEELKKFRLLSEYSFYTEEPEDDDELLLGSKLGEADEETDQQGQAQPADGDDSKTATNDNPADQANQIQPTQPPTNQSQDMSQPVAGGDDIGQVDDTNTLPADGADDGDTAMPSDDEVEVDVTQLVQGSEEATKAANDASQKTSELLAKFGELEQRVSSMNSLSSKIDTLEKEIVKRNPTPIEKLEMRSMDSYPYNIKLTDYWNDVEGYDTGSNQNKKKEYILTKDDVDGGFTDASVKKSFDTPEEYEEEDI